MVPRALRREARLAPGTEVELRLVDGRIEIEPSPTPVKLVRRGGLLVAEPLDASGSLTHAEVEATLDSIRADRGR